MKLHIHHITPVHKGGKDGPTIVIDECEHAEIHAIRFINGEDNGFYMSQLPLLDPKLQELVKQRQSELMKTEWNPGYGTSYVEGRHWYNNGEVNVYEYECPFGFVEGRLLKPQPKQRETMVGRSWWNNGILEKFSHECPEGYIKGRLPGQKRRRKG